MTIEIPTQCRRMVREYADQGYTVVQSEFPSHLLQLETGFSGAVQARADAPPVVYITLPAPGLPARMLKKFKPLAFLNRDAENEAIISIDNGISNKGWTQEFIKEGIKRLL